MVTQDCPTTDSFPRPPWRLLEWTSIVLVMVGIVSRLLPLFSGERRLFRQFPTEDGYLMLTIARNMSFGFGMSTAAGTIPTNGTQPLMTAIYSQGFEWFDGDRASGVGFALAIQFGLAVLGAVLLYMLTRQVLVRHPASQRIALLATAIWFSSGISVRHSMNCLETGAFAATVVLFALALLNASDPFGVWSKRRTLGLGALLGMALWTRMDAVFLVGSACLVRMLMTPEGILRPSLARFASAAMMGGTAVAIISPWLLYNQVNFGSIMPVSGRAESSFGSFGSNLPHLPIALAEYIIAAVPVPSRFESITVIRVGASVIVVFAGWLCARVWNYADSRVRALVFLVSLYAAGLCTYYGLFFGAHYFLSRYLFPVFAFTALLWAWALNIMIARLPQRVTQITVALAVLIFVSVANLRIYRRGNDHQHFQVVRWIEENVDDTTWVGAVQTGTVGFFHDRSINLDGKVNPAAHAATRVGRIPEYILEQPIQILADWAEITKWADIPVLAGHFDVVVNDPEANLGVLKRRQIQ
jgi:hypothetical protein